MSKIDELTKSVLELVKLGKIDKELAFNIIKELKQASISKEVETSQAKDEILATSALAKSQDEITPKTSMHESVTGNSEEASKFNSLSAYLDTLIALAPSPITFSGDKPNCLNRWLVKRERVDYQKYKQIEPNINLSSELISDTDYLIKEKFVDDWQYYVAKELKSDFTDFSRNYPYTLFTDNQNDDYFIYSLCGIYCDSEKDVVFHVDAITSIRIWINGQIVFTSSYKYHVKTQVFAYRLKKGNNAILVERPSFVEYRNLNIPFDFFSINIKPYSFLMKREFKDFIDTNLLKDLGNQYVVLPDQAFFAENEQITFIVIPKRFRDEKAEQVEIDIANAKGKILTSLRAFTSQKISIALNETGALKIAVRSLANPKKAANGYLFRGDFLEYMTRLIEKGKNISNDSPNILATLEGLKELFDTRTGCFNGMPELVNISYYNLIFAQCVAFEKFLESDKCEKQRGLVQIFGKDSLNFEECKADNGSLAYTVHFPGGYDQNKKYPLVIFMSYGYAASKYPIIPDFIQGQDFTEAIVVTICGRGDLAFDYINDFSIIKLIEKLTVELNIDHNRLYAMGICIGAVKGIWMGIRTPHMLAAIASVTGIMWSNLRGQHFSLLQNITNSPVLQLANLDDIVYNCNGFSEATRQLKKLKYWIVNSFSHVDFEEYFASRKLLVKMINERKVIYPRSINFIVYEQYYNKSYWIEIEYITDLNKLASIEGEIKGKNLISLKTDNIGQIALLLNRQKMRLGENIHLQVNNLKEVIRINSFARVLITITSDALKLEVTDLTEEMFEKEYASIIPREEFLGMRQVFMQKCLIIKPDYLDKKLFEKRLAAILQKPFKLSIRNYKYNLLLESQANPEVLSQNNFVYILDARYLNEFEQKILENTEFRIKASGLEYKNTLYEGDYFTVFECKNPFNNSKQALFVVYNNETIQEELINFLNNIQFNPLFYNQAVIYAKGKYHGHRAANFMYAPE